MIRNPHFSLAGILIAALVWVHPHLWAQVQVADEVQLSLDGTVSTAYSGSFGSEQGSTHGIGFGGNGNLNGSYHSPNFLSFTLSPFYDQSRSSSNFSAINDSSGVNARANIFAGSRFPGYVNYSRLYNSESDYLIPGVANFKTNGNHQNFGVGWNFNFRNLPVLTVGYQQGGADTTLYGAQRDNLSNFHALFANAVYAFDGFHLGGGVHHSTGNSEFPEFVAGQPVEKTHSETTAYTFNVNRSIAWSGSTWANFTRDTTGYDTAGFSSSQTGDIISGGVVLKPLEKLSTQFVADYNDSLAGTLYQLVNSAGVLAPVSIPAGESHSWGVFGQAQYTIVPGLFAGGSISHRQQLFLGINYDSTAYSGALSFGHHFFGGQFNSSATVTHNTLANRDSSMLGLLTNASYIRQIGAWNVSGSFNYSENVQTFLVAYTSSGYGYSSSVSRRIGKLNWNGSASGSKTLLSQQAGTASFNQGYSTGLSGGWLSGGVGYSRSSGSGLFTVAGISPLPGGVPPELLPTSVLFGGTTYSATLGSTPIRGLTVNATYARSEYTTNNGLLPANNKTEQVNSYLLYRFRKMYFNAGYNRLVQGFSASGLPPEMVSSYYFGISRWFRFF
jgi:hypothetical protein